MMKFARRTASEDDSLQCQRIGTSYSRDNTPGFQFSFLQSPEHAMPLSHRCCISSSSVFIASLFAEVIRDNCNLKHALTVWCLPAHGVGRLFFITVMVFALPDYDAIMTGLRRDSVSDDAIASCLFPGSIPCWASCCQGASWSIVDFLGDYVEPIPHEREVYVIGICVRASA